MLVLNKYEEKSKDMIKEMFSKTIKQSPDRAIELFVSFVKVYKDKIEIGLNTNQNLNLDTETVYIKVFAETFTRKRHFKGGTNKIQEQSFDVYVVM